MYLSIGVEECPCIHICIHENSIVAHQLISCHAHVPHPVLACSQVNQLAKKLVTSFTVFFDGPVDATSPIHNNHSTFVMLSQKII